MVKKLLYLNGWAILSTVLNHTYGWGLIAMILWTHRYQAVEVPNFDQVGGITYYILRFIGQLIIFAIPAFIFVSGFFVSFATGRNRNTISWNNVFSRIKFLLIPYLFWCTIAILGYILEGNNYSLLDYVKMIATGTIKGPYYFIPLLIQLYLISPLLVPFARKNWKWLLIVAAFIQIIAQLTYYPRVLDLDVPITPIPNWLFLMRIFWFALGISIGFHIKEFKPWFVKVKWLSFILTILFFVVGFIEWELIFRKTHFFIPIETLVDSFYALFFLLTFFGFESISLPFSNIFNKLGSNTLGIYLAHVPAQEFPARFIYNFLPWLLGIQPLFLPIIFIFGLFGPLILMEIVQKSPARRYYQYIFG